LSTKGRIPISLLCGVLLTILTRLAAARIDHPFWSPVLMWPLVLTGALHNALFGPGPLIGYDAQGQPMYEGTPVLLLVGLLGLLLAVAVYWGLSYLALRLLARRRQSGLR
jgi:hypothetical protein